MEPAVFIGYLVAFVAIAVYIRNDYIKEGGSEGQAFLVGGFFAALGVSVSLIVFEVILA